jgi:hypothetical protein
MCSGGFYGLRIMRKSICFNLIFIEIVSKIKKSYWYLYGCDVAQDIPTVLTPEVIGIKDISKN